VPLHHRVRSGTDQCGYSASISSISHRQSHPLSEFIQFSGACCFTTNLWFINILVCFKNTISTLLNPSHVTNSVHYFWRIYFYRARIECFAHRIYSYNINKLYAMVATTQINHQSCSVTERTRTCQ
jgi:hypothetical protein